jgi:hypothetical protein
MGHTDQRIILEINWTTAWKEKAYTQWAFLESIPQAAQTLLDYVALSPTRTDAADLLFQAGRIYERNARCSLRPPLYGNA